MLSLSIKSGDYITIGRDIVVQIFREGPDARVEIKAPRELTILRGEVHERTGEKPEGLLAKRPKSLSEQTRNTKRAERFAEKKACIEHQKQQLLAIAGHLDRLSENLSDAEERRELQELTLKLVQTVSGENAGETRGA